MWRGGTSCVAKKLFLRGLQLLSLLRCQGFAGVLPGRGARVMAETQIPKQLVIFEPKIKT